MNANFEESCPKDVDLAQCNHEGLQNPQKLIPSSSFSLLIESYERPNQTSNFMALLCKRIKGSESTFCTR